MGYVMLSLENAVSGRGWQKGKKSPESMNATMDRFTLFLVDFSKYRVLCY